MIRQTVFVTGASGFIGRQLVRSLLSDNFKVHAGVHHHHVLKEFDSHPDFKAITIDICDKNSLTHVFNGVDFLYHFAASVNAGLPAHELYRINMQGTKNVWEAASAAGVKKALYCSTTAVYGLLSKNGNAITEDERACAVEPYGRSKLEGEIIVNKFSDTNKIESVIIRPAAVFGPGDHTSFGTSLRKAAYSKLLLSGGFKDKKFSYVQVQDVARAAIYLMASDNRRYNLYNIAVDTPIDYDQAFKCYMNALAGTGIRNMIPRALGKISDTIEQRPAISGWLRSLPTSRLVFRIWKPGFDLTYSPQRILATGFKFQWADFENVIASCLHKSMPEHE